MFGNYLKNQYIMSVFKQTLVGGMFLVLFDRVKLEIMQYWKMNTHAIKIKMITHIITSSIVNFELSATDWQSDTIVWLILYNSIHIMLIFFLITK